MTVWMTVKMKETTLMAFWESEGFSSGRWHLILQIAGFPGTDCRWLSDHSCDLWRWPTTIEYGMRIQPDLKEVSMTTARISRISKNAIPTIIVCASLALSGSAMAQSAPTDSHEGRCSNR